MNARSDVRVIRNPLLGLQSVRKLQDLDPVTRFLLMDVLVELKMEARDRAENCWRKHKAPMAAYWKAVSVYAGHLARTLGGAK